jgi:hypothetical protein
MRSLLRFNMDLLPELSPEAYKTNQAGSEQE